MEQLREFNKVLLLLGVIFTFGYIVQLVPLIFPVAVVVLQMIVLIVVLIKNKK